VYAYFILVTVITVYVFLLSNQKLELELKERMKKIDHITDVCRDTEEELYEATDKIEVCAVFSYACLASIDWLLQILYINHGLYYCMVAS